MGCVRGEMAPYFRKLERMSSALAFSSDLTMGVLGGSLKFKERLSARLGAFRMIRLGLIPMTGGVLAFWLLSGSTHPIALFLPMQLCFVITSVYSR